MIGPAWERVRDAIGHGNYRTAPGKKRVTCECPAHDDGTPSLSVTQHTDGIGVKCWVGCTAEQIARAWGFTGVRALYDDYDPVTDSRRTRADTATGRDELPRWLADDPTPPPATPIPPKPELAQRPRSGPTWADRLAGWQHGNADVVEWYADKIGVPASALRRLGVGINPARELIVPERDGKFEIIGLSVRRADGTKSFVAGGRRGLTMATDWDVGGPVFMPEGATCTAALIAYGATAIGRPSNTGGVSMLSELLAPLVAAGRRLVIVGERDKKRPDGKSPGRDGAIDTAQSLAGIFSVAVRVVFPPAPHKDVRDAYNAGVSFDELLAGFHASCETIEPPPPRPKIDGRPVHGDVVTLDEYRDGLAGAIDGALSTVGLSLIRAPVGTGKSYTVNVAFKNGAAGERKTLTALPTHENCRERADEMKSAGIPEKQIGVMPELSADNCENIDNARAALAAGFTVGGAVCPDCPCRRGCEYIRLVSRARRAKHLIGSHERIARGGGAEWFRERDVVVIDERPELALAPAVRVTIDELRGAVAALDVVLKSSGVGTMDLAAWEPGRDATPSAAARNARAIAVDIIGFADGIDAPGVHRPEIPDGVHTDARAEIELFGALQRAGVTPPPMAIRAIGLISSTEYRGVSVTVCADGSKTVSVDANAVLDGKTVLMLDGTADAENLSALVGHTVHDITPPGQLAAKQTLAQIVFPVGKSTSARTVAGIITELVERTGAVRAGIIAHKSQIGELFREVEPILAGFIRRRVAMFSYFGAGPDRGSNRWHHECDALFVIGNPRIPPRAIRAALASAGNPAAGRRDGHFGPYTWTAETIDGETVEFRGNGYADDEWRAAAGRANVAAIRQAIGRARVTLPGGIPCVVVCDEPIGVPVADVTLAPRMPRAMAVIAAIHDEIHENAGQHGVEPNWAENGQRPIRYLIGKRPESAQTPFRVIPTVPRGAIVARTGLDESHLAKAVDALIAGGEIHIPATGWLALGPAPMPGLVGRYGWIGADPTGPGRAAETIRANGGRASANQIVADGLARRTLTDIANNPASGIIRIGRGEYAVAAEPMATGTGNAVAHAQSTGGVVCVRFPLRAIPVDHTPND